MEKLLKDLFRKLKSLIQRLATPQKKSISESTNSTEKLADSAQNIIDSFPVTRKIFDRDFELVTQPFNSTHHRGVDLRCVDDKTRQNLPVRAPEKMMLLRQGKDRYGNYFLVAKGLESAYDELKFIHIDMTSFPECHIFEAGDPISYCIMGGNSRALHLHFETWSLGQPLMPDLYFLKMGIEYKYKGEE